MAPCVRKRAAPYDGERSAILLHVSFNRIRLKDKTCSRSKCHSDLCASDKTLGAVADEAQPMRGHPGRFAK
ncbi:hypothetical protein CDO24_18110 [Sinorhizobium meliloti]|nr:hypothetical protein CDO24_18110 [Sinorhizobium meliloti]